MQAASAPVQRGLRARRVTQLDAGVLDAELQTMLASSVLAAANSLHDSAGDRYCAEINTIVAAMLLPVSATGVTPGMKLQRLGYRAIPLDGGLRDALSPSRLRITLFALCRVVGTWLQERADVVRSHPTVQRITSAPGWWWAVLAWRAVVLGNFLAFLRHGRYSGVLERVFRLTMVHSTVADAHVVPPSYDFVIRNLLYSGVAGFASAVVSMADWGKWWRRSRSMSRTVYMRVVRWLATWFRVLRRFAGKSALVSSVLKSMSPRVESAATVAPEVKQPVLQHASRRPQPCMLCGSSPPMMAYQTACGHFACYFCLHSAVLGDPSFSCVVCGERIDSSRRL